MGPIRDERVVVVAVLSLQVGEERMKLTPSAALEIHLRNLDRRDT